MARLTKDIPEQDTEAIQEAFNQAISRIEKWRRAIPINEILRQTGEPRFWRSYAFCSEDYEGNTYSGFKVHLKDSQTGQQAFGIGVLTDAINLALDEFERQQVYLVKNVKVSMGVIY